MTDESAALEREAKVIEERSRRHAREAGLVLNPDAKKLRMLFTALARRKVRYGEFYCPCRVVTGDREKDKPNICPCEPHLREAADHGHCLCELFFKPAAEGRK
jgi:ferredoxin-thioredoxin reductase catalytic subunit